MEIFDVVNEQGIPTGETVERADAHDKGIRHRTAHVWVVRKQNGIWQVLLQKRSECKDSHPGQYDTSSAGHIHAGDEPRDSALRELQEELGIQAEADDLNYIGRFDIFYEKSFHGRMFRDNEVSFVYVYTRPVDESKICLQEEEVQSAEWFDFDAVEHALTPPRDTRFCIPSGGFELINKWRKEQH